MQALKNNFATDLARDLPSDMLRRIEEFQEDWLHECGEGFGHDVLTGPCVTTTVAVQLATAHGYDCTIPWLAKQAQEGKFVMPRPFGVEFAWLPDDVLRLFQHLHRERRWFPTCHDYAKTAAELAAEKRETEQAEQMLAHFRTLSIDELTRLEGQITGKYPAVMLRTALREKLAQQATEATECEPMPSSR